MSSAYNFLGLILFGLLAYCNAIDHPFVHDDVVFILLNPHITALSHWWEAFQVPGASGGINTYYRPVLEIIYRLEFRLFGPQAWGFHLFNAFIHIINGLLLLRLLQKMGLTRRVAWVVALLFLIHPVQTEAVSCISGISNLWMALGVLLALHANLNKWYLASGLSFALAFLSKEQAVLFLPLLLVINISSPEKFETPKRNLQGWLLLGCIFALLMELRHHITGASLLHDLSVSPRELYLRLAAIPRDLGMYLRVIFFPFDLHYYRSTDILKSNALAWTGFLAALGCIAYVFKRFPQARQTLVLGGGWFLAALLPVLNITPLINEYSFILTSEHFLYLPIVGILILVVVAADHYLPAIKKPLLGLVIAICLLLTWHQNTFWRSEIALFERMLQFEPDFGRGHLLLAKAYYFNGEPSEADGHYRKALVIMNSYIRKATNLTAREFYLKYIREIFYDWSQNDGAQGHWAQALAKLKMEEVIDDRNAAMFNNMAFVYLHLGDKMRARSSLQQALRVDPSFAQARNNLQSLDSSP